MGTLIYEGSIRVEVDDRAMAHIQIVMNTKLRRKEPFFYTWRDDASLGGGRTSIWIHPAAMLVFKYQGSRVPAINHTWLEALVFTANSSEGMYLMPEPTNARAMLPA